MLHNSQKNHVPFANELPAPSLGYEVYALSRSASENDFISTRRSDILRNALPRSFVRFRRARAQHVQSAMDICIVTLIKISHRLDHRARLLRSRSAIEINQGMAVRLLAKNGKIVANRAPIDSSSDNLVHTTICSTPRRAPLYSNNSVEALDLNRPPAEEIATQ